MMTTDDDERPTKKGRVISPLQIAISNYKYHAYNVNDTTTR